MKYTILLISVLLFSCLNPKPEAKALNEKDLKDVLEMQLAAWNDGNIDSFMSGYWRSDSLRFISKRGQRFGYDSVLAMYRKHYDSKEKMGTLTFTDLTFYPMSTEPRIANVCGKWNISGSDSAGGYFSLIMKEMKGEWKIICDHTW